jgi:hypothetical protein
VKILFLFLLRFVAHRALQKDVLSFLSVSDSYCEIPEDFISDYFHCLEQCGLHYKEQ